MKKIIFILLGISNICPSVYAGDKNLHYLVEGRTLKIYLSRFQSETEKVSPDIFRNILKNILLTRKKENFEVVEDSESAEIIIDCNILSFKYLEKDPIDNIVGGTTALIIDALVKQNYANIEVKFTVKRAKDNKKLWQDRFVSSITQTNMSEFESIPKVINECSKRFIHLCFGKPKR